jgi:hypothetical protein
MSYELSHEEIMRLIEAVGSIDIAAIDIIFDHPETYRTITAAVADIRAIHRESGARRFSAHLAASRESLATSLANLRAATSSAMGAN